MVNIVVHNYELNQNLLRITVPFTTPDMEGKIKYFFDIKAKLKEVSIQYDAPESHPLNFR